MIGLHIDDRGRSSRDEIRKFIDHYGITYTVALATDDMFVAYLGTDDPGTHEKVVKDDSIPQTLVFGRDGKLIKHLIGYTPSHGKLLDEAVNEDGFFVYRASAEEGEFERIATIRLYFVTGLGRHQRRRDHLALHAQHAQLPKQNIAGRAGLIAGTQFEASSSAF